MSITTKVLKSHNASVELKVTLKREPKLDLSSQSNPRIFLLLQDSQGSGWINHSHNQSEHIENELYFIFILEYHFEELQKIKLVVANGDISLNLESQGSASNEQGLIGEFVTDIGSILGKSKGILKGGLVLTERPEEDRGQIILSGRELPPKNGKTFNLKVQGHNLQLPPLVVKPDVFYKLSRRIKGNSDIHSNMRVFHESERRYSRNPDWSAIKLSEGDLQNGEFNDEVCLTCWQHKRDGIHKSIGECVLKIDKLLSSNKVSLIPKGELLLQCAFENTFLDYIAGGLEIRLSIAIDFTSSNRHYIYGIDLHNISCDETNYGRAIRFVGNILENYSTDGRIPVYGFGGKFYGSEEVSHSFPLNQNYQSNVLGISGVLETYQKALENVILSSPTKFAPTIQSVISRLKSFANNFKVYEVLLIITYGLIDDMESTIEAIMQASVLPLSIVIISVGTADRENMNKLADFKSYNWGNLKQRDIVHFVAMNDFENQNQINKDLPKAALEKIPSQVMDYMSQNGIIPR
ncbi:22837_t:CDS:1 [Gigaspora margarita]|uniref:22837_t:CDS:1 n=1 Tax=Gigaspora margarita TaxID=4874 RepID=A0ABN7UV43_GIGMA|nr:22837_t:CDS:1 [Gigaspora margarita]